MTIENHSVCTQSIEVGRLHIGGAIATHGTHSLIIRKQEDDVGTLIFRLKCNHYSKQTTEIKKPHTHL